VRRSVRDYTDRALSLYRLSRLLWAAQGITEERLEFRAAPSAGALYPIELYPIVHNVSDLPSGIYHYAVREHALERLERGDFRSGVTQAGLYQGFLAQANVCLVLSALYLDGAGGVRRGGLSRRDAQRSVGTGWCRRGRALHHQRRRKTVKAWESFSPLCRSQLDQEHNAGHHQDGGHDPPEQLFVQ
jgi:hypothetical protein